MPLFQKSFMVRTSMGAGKAASQDKFSEQLTVTLSGELLVHDILRWEQPSTYCLSLTYPVGK